MLNVPLMLLLAALLPLLSFLLLSFLRRALTRSAGILAASLIFLSMALSIGALFLWVEKPEFNQPHYIESFSFNWITLHSTSPPTIPSPEFPGGPSPAPMIPAITLGILADSLTVAFFLVVTFITFLAHLYALAYFPHRDAHSARFFARLGLLSFSALALFLSHSLLQSFIFWQLLGLAACLLIGLRSDYRTSAQAFLKSFTLQFLGDLAFLLGLGLLILHTGSLSLDYFGPQGPSALSASLRDTFGLLPSEFLKFTGGTALFSLHWLTWTGLLFFAAASAKAAQFPFSLWANSLAQAPAPAAALIAGATSTAAATFLLARIFPILTLDARLAIAILGTTSILTASLIACIQTDLRKILAWSAVAQLGYVTLFFGVGAYRSALPQFFTSAFLLAGLFLVAGTLLDALQHDPRASDIRNLGGLWRKLPITAATSLLLTLALAGIPWLSGAYSRETGLAALYDYCQALTLAHTSSPLTSPPPLSLFPLLLFLIPTLSAAPIAFAMTRFWILTFAGKPRLERLPEKLFEQADEPALMTLPLIILAGFSLGFLFDFFLPSLISRSLPLPFPRPTEGAFAMVIVGARWAVAFGLATAGTLYFSGPAPAERLRNLPILRPIIAWLRHALFLEALYDLFLAFIVGIARLATLLDTAYTASLLTLANLTRSLARLLTSFDALYTRRPPLPSQRPSPEN